MKNKLFLLFAACLVGTAAFAQWTAPEVPTTASTFETGHLYRVRNADGQQGYLAGGTAWYSWATSTVLLFDLSVQDPITYSFTMDYDEDGNELGYTFMNNSTSLYTFISGELEVEGYEGLGEMHMDGASSNYSKHFDITLVSGTTYQISVAATDTIYGETKAGTCLGYMPNAEEYIGAVYPFLNPSNAVYACTWEFIDMTMYQARLDLYDALVESTNYADIDQNVIEAATEVYNNANATIEELEAATLDVKTARNNAITKDASTENPVDATILIENPDFETGDISGWYCSYTSEVNAQNVGYQSASYYNYTYTYINHEGVETNPFVNHFLEAWTYTNYSDDAVVDACIGDGELSQTIKEMPKGNWKLSADVIACQQYESVDAQYGVQLFATSGDYDMSIDISTGDGVPEHIELLFASSGDDLTLGLRTQSTNCNWIAADNFELVCYGDEDSAYKFILEQTIDDCVAEFPNVDDVRADNELKSAYEEALNEAQSVLSGSNNDAELEAASDALSAAADALSTSVAEYKTVGEYIDYILSVETMADGNGWDELVDNLATYRESTLEPGYEDGTLTSEQIAEMEDVVTGMIADYISEYCQAGDDISILITNNDFDTDFSGWTYNVAPNWGGDGSAGGGENTLEGKPTMAEIASGNAEYYWTAFDINQTIKNMPAGLYKLTLQVFERDDAGDGIDAVMYASAGGSEQTALVTDIYRDAQEEMQYSTGAGASVWPDDTYTEGIGYTPNSMAGANVYFYEGFYTTTFNILLTERGDLTIGLRKDNATDWVLFDTFRLVYQGNDASAYADAIQELIDEAMALGDEVVIEEANTMLGNAMDAGYDAMYDGDADDCIAAIAGLQEAIAFAQEGIALVEDLDYLYEYTNEIRLDKVDNATDDSFLELMDEIGSAIAEGVFETNAQVEGYMLSLKTDFTTYAMSAYTDGTIEVSEDDPADVSAVIMTPDGVDNADEGSTFGWDLNDGTGVGLGYGATEIYNQEAGVGMSQVLYNLATGWYRLGVQAFYRPGNAFGTNILIPTEEIEEADTIHYADFYAGDKATRVLSIYADAETYDMYFSNGGTYLTVPNTMEEANYAFENELYQNILQFEVAEDGTDVTIGIKKTGYVSGDWLIWDNWTLQYLGTTTPENDPTTDVEGVESEGAPVATTIYSVNGMRQSKLVKGINIVKTTMADGTVNVTKVLVK